MTAPVRLDALLDALRSPVTPAVTGAAASDVMVTDVVLDTRHVQPGALFCCVAGRQVDGHDLAPDAVAAGAVAVLAERPVAVPEGTAVLAVDDVRAAMGPLAAAYWGHPS